MAKTEVLVVDPRADWYETVLSAWFDRIRVSSARSFEEAAEELSRAEVLVTLGVPLMGVHFTADVAARMPRLKWVQCLLSGYERIQRALAGRDDVLVTTAAGIHGPQMSEIGLLHMLMLGRGVRTMLRNQDEHVWQRLPQRILEEKVVGIVGMGAVGTHLARICKALGMTVYGVSRTEREIECVDRVFRRGELMAVASQVDYLVLVVPAEPETTHLVDACVLAAMKPTAYLINLARGSIVDEEALIASLEREEIGGAGLDVFAAEPLPAESPLWALPNVTITPHTGGLHDRYAEQTLAVLEPNLSYYLEGRTEQMINLIGGAS